MAANSGPIRYSLVIPVFNEEAVLPILLRRLDLLLSRLDGPAEAIFVDDGSSDSSSIVLQALAVRDARFRYIGLSRNFGHQVAITAGMDAAQGDAIIVMDADLQDPPEVIEQLIAKWHEGNDVVHARRLSREGESRFKRATAHLFYRLLGKMSSVGIPADVGDFRLIDRKVLDALRRMPEQDRFVRGMIAWLGFRQAEVTFHRLERAAGETKYPLFKMIRLAVNAALGFSDLPLRLAIWCGLTVSAFALLYGGWVVVMWLSNDTHLVTGWSSTIVLLSLLCGMNMLMTGIVGLYVGRIHAEVKRRPLYVIQKRAGFDRNEAATVPAKHAITE
ncbi:glycosyltransferase family 2 protein [Bradyrhizobium sp. NBAIM08]|uniref:glycosyltransferase family 2 protein n=1 Tax=Bradyrhizobium sp. NBAIM08 TaxID=2793815 RepID=UPI001CD58124|nr:glycosyltransferase family 2 protein [Bradyrhizobium sp. NBAIM08]MCA1475579.1 glycosyltransferase family 2 protein [Bradyrhizobium sp. NBAIM08]